MLLASPTVVHTRCLNFSFIAFCKPTFIECHHLTIAATDARVLTSAEIVAIPPGQMIKSPAIRCKTNFFYASSVATVGSGSDRVTPHRRTKSPSLSHRFSDELDRTAIAIMVQFICDSELSHR